MLNYCSACNNNNMGKDSTLVGWNKEHCAARSYTDSVTTLLFHTKKFLPGEHRCYTLTLYSSCKMALIQWRNLFTYESPSNWVISPERPAVHKLKVRPILQTLPERSLCNLAGFHIFWHKELDLLQFHLSILASFLKLFLLFNWSCLCIRSSK